MSDDQFTKLLGHIDKRLDEGFARQDKRLDERFVQQDERLNERFVQQDERLNERLAQQDKRLDQQFAQFIGQMTEHFDKRFNELTADVTAGIDSIHTSVDGIAKRLDTDEAERAAMANQLERHERWHRQSLTSLT